MFEEAGHPMRTYDPFFADHPDALRRRYDFITATEVVEHLHHPGREFDRLFGLLRPGGVLAVMTKRVIDRERFATWHYKNDLTHVCFLADATFEWIARRRDAGLTFEGDDVAVIRKND